MNPHDFRRIGHELIEWIASYREQLEKYPAMSRVEPGEIRQKLSRDVPQKGKGLDGLLSDLDQVVMPGITHWNHPGFFAYFPSNSDLSSVLGDLAAAGLGAQGMSWLTSPAATEMEDVVMDWLRQMVGLPEAFTGVIQDSASSSALCALLCARERSTAFGQNRGGFQDENKSLVVYASREAHSSVPKAVLLAGFGKDNLRLIETDAQNALCLKALERAICEDLDAGRVPCAVVASIGTTLTTAIDPLEGIVELAQTHGLWVHVDAAMAGSAMVCPELRWMWKGIEGVDSLVFNPHKWMGVGFDCSAYFVRDSEHLVRVMSTNPAYLQTPQDGEVRNLRDWGIPLGRRFRAMKLYCLLMDQGAEGIAARIRRDLEFAQTLSGWVKAKADWQCLTPVPLQTLCIRHCPPDLDDEALDRHNRGILERINAKGHFYLSPALYQGRAILRISIGSQNTRKQDIEGLWVAVQQEGAMQ